MRGHEARGSDYGCLGVVGPGEDDAGKQCEQEREENLCDKKNAVVTYKDSQDSGMPGDYDHRGTVEYIDKTDLPGEIVGIIKEENNSMLHLNPPDSPDSGMERGSSEGSDDNSLPVTFTAMITTIEGHLRRVWLVPSIMQGKQKLVDKLLRSLTRKIPEP